MDQSSAREFPDMPLEDLFCSFVKGLRELQTEQGADIWTDALEDDTDDKALLLDLLDLAIRLGRRLCIKGADRISFSSEEVRADLDLSNILFFGEIEHLRRICLHLPGAHAWQWRWPKSMSQLRGLLSQACSEMADETLPITERIWSLLSLFQLQVLLCVVSMEGFMQSLKDEGTQRPASPSCEEPSGERSLQKFVSTLGSSLRDLRKKNLDTYLWFRDRERLYMSEARYLLTCFSDTSWTLAANLKGPLDGDMNTGQYPGDVTSAVAYLREQSAMFYIYCLVHSVSDDLLDHVDTEMMISRIPWEFSAYEIVKDTGLYQYGNRIFDPQVWIEEFPIRDLQKRYVDKLAIACDSSIEANLRAEALLHLYRLELLFYACVVRRIETDPI